MFLNCILQLSQMVLLSLFQHLYALVCLLKLFCVVVCSLFCVFPTHKFLKVAVELSGLYRCLLFASQRFSLLESLSHHPILLFRSGLQKLLSFDSVYVSFLLKLNVLTVGRFKSAGLPAFVFRLGILNSQFSVYLRLAFALQQVLHNQIPFIFQVLDLLSFLPCGENFHHIFVFFSLQVVHAIFNFLFVDASLLQSKLCSSGRCFEVMLNEPLSIFLRTGLGLI